MLFFKSLSSFGEQGSFLFLSYLGKHPWSLRHSLPRDQAATTAACPDQTCGCSNPKYPDSLLSNESCAQTGTTHTATTTSRNSKCISTNPAKISSSCLFSLIQDLGWFQSSPSLWKTWAQPSILLGKGHLCTSIWVTAATWSKGGSPPTPSFTKDWTPLGYILHMKYLQIQFNIKLYTCSGVNDEKQADHTKRALP